MTHDLRNATETGVGSLPTLLTVREAAAILRLSPITVYERARQRPDVYGRVQLGGREVRLRAEAIRRLLAGEREVPADARAAPRTP